MERKPVSRILLILLLITLLTSVFDLSSNSGMALASPEEMIFVDPPSIIDPGLTSGSTFTVNINVSEVVDLYSWQIMIEWDPSILDLTTITFGDFLADQPGGTLPNQNVNQEAGFAGFGETSRGDISGVDGSGWLAAVEFLVEVDEGETVLDISGGDFQLTFYTKSTAPSTPVYPTIESGYFSNIPVPTFDLTISVDGSGTTDPVPGVHTYEAFTVVNVTAFPDTSWMLDRWELDGVDVGDANPYAVIMDADHTLTAYFNSKPPKPISIYTDKQNYSAGDTMHIGLDINNPLDSPITVCVAIWAFRPDNSIYILLHAHAVTLPASLTYSNPDFETFVLPSIPSGVYTWHAALVDPATHTILIEDTAEWQFI